MFLPSNVSITMKKKVLIIFTDEHLPYSMTTINLYDTLSESFDVQIVAFEPAKYMKTHESESRNIDYIRTSEEIKLPKVRLLYFLFRLGLKLGFLKFLKTLTPSQKLKTFILWNRIRQLRADEVIGVDFLALWIAQIVFNKGHLVSLEVNKNNLFYNLVNKDKIQSVIIQTEERYQYLFSDSNLKKFLVQNAPIYKPLKSVPSSHKELIFCGTAIPEFGVYQCLDFIASDPEFSLTIRGGITTGVKEKMQTDYRHLIEEKD